MILGAALPLQFRESWLAINHTVRGAEKILFNSDHITDGAVMDSLDGFGVPGVISALQTGNEAQSLLLCQFGRPLHELDADWIDAMRFLHEDVLSSLNCGHSMKGVELGRVGNQYHIRRLDHVLVAVEAGEAVIVVQSTMT